MKRLLAIAGWLCGESACRRVFEPLIADWDRELQEALTRSVAVRAGIVVRGSIALTTTLVLSAVQRSWSMEAAMWKYGVGAFALAVGLSMVSEAALIGYSTPIDYPPDMLLIAAVRFGGAAALAPAMLPALLLLRRDSRAHLGTAFQLIVFGMVFVGVGVTAQPWLDDYVPTAGQNERMYQRLRANDRAGQLQYPGTAMRERRGESTPEERRASYERFREQRARALAADPPGPTPWQRLRRSNTAVLAVLFGAVGWMLGAVVQPTWLRALVWWAAAWLTTMVADGRLTDMFSLPGLRLSWWTLPSVLAIAALALALASTRRQPGTGTLAPTP